MKNLARISTLLIVALITKASNAQDGVRFSEMYLNGKYEAECPIEVKDHSGMYYCELCSFNIDPNDKQIASFGSVEFDFGQDSLTYIKNGKSITVPFTRNKDTHAFSFTINEKQFSFRVFHFDDMNIIEDGDGMLMVLTRLE